VVLFFLAPLWIAEAFAVWIMRIRPDGSPSPFDSLGMLLSFIVLPAIAGAVVALRGGSHFARLAAGACLCGAGFITLALFESHFEAYRFVFGKTVLLALVPQGVSGWVGGLVAALAAKRFEWDLDPARRIGAREGTGTGLLLMGAWAVVVSRKWLGGVEISFGLVVFACGVAMLALAFRGKGREGAAPARSGWAAVIGGTVAVLAVPWMLEMITFGAQAKRVASQEARSRDRLKAMCANFTVLDWRFDPGVALVGKPELRVRVRAKADSAVEMRYAFLYDERGRRIAAGQSSSVVDVYAGRESTLAARMERVPKSDTPALVLWAFCAGPGDDAEACAWWGRGNTALLRDGPSYCPTPSPSP
jgi:hypothetical protein